METVKIKKETFDKVAAFKSKNPDCKNFDDALGLFISDLENAVQIQKDEAVKFQNGLHDKNHQLDAKQKEINKLIEQGTNGTAEQRERIQELENQLAELADEIEKKDLAIEEIQQQLEQSVKDTNDNGQIAHKSQLKIDELTEQLEKAQNEIILLKQTPHATPTPENTIQLLPPVQQIMDLVAKKLSDKYKQQINVADIINKMVLRYNVERWTEWFYPFCVSDKEIKEITGKSTDELKQFFNGK